MTRVSGTSPTRPQGPAATSRAAASRRAGSHRRRRLSRHRRRSPTPSRTPSSIRNRTIRRTRSRTRRPSQGNPPPGHPPGSTGHARGRPQAGAMPLRPLGLGDIYDAAFRIIRFNPRATVGAAVLVTAVAMLIPVVVTAVLTYSVNLTLDPGTDGFTGERPRG